MVKDLFLVISALMFMTYSPLSTESEEALVATPELSLTPLTIGPEDEKRPLKLQSLCTISTTNRQESPLETTSVPIKRKPSKTLPLQRTRRKSSESPQKEKIISPRLRASSNHTREFLENKKNCTSGKEGPLSSSSEKKFASSSHLSANLSEKQKILLDHSHLKIPDSEGEKEFVRDEGPKRFRKFSLEGPLKPLTIITPLLEEQMDFSGLEEHTDSCARDISPMRHQRNSIF